jgi:sulfide:quinone oxidoreductase
MAHMPTATGPKRSALRILIAGGGVAGVEALLALRQLAEERVEIELLAAEPQFWYRPLAVGEPFDLGELHGLDLGLVADDLGAVLTLGTLDRIDLDAHLAYTPAGTALEYDVLLIAVGARPVAAVPGALTFRGPADTTAFRSLLDELTAGSADHVVFALPGGTGWPLPLYELALQTATHVHKSGSGAQLVLVTPEERPLGLFGPAASEAITALLEERDVEVYERVYPVAFERNVLVLKPGGTIVADRVVALPRLEGPRIAGVPRDAHGFIPTDASGRVHGLTDAYAAGDATSFPVKQGGLAAQQADAAAEAIAAMAGAELTPQPFRPILRGLILTGGAPLFTRAELTGTGQPYEAGTDALWWPPGKIVGRYLAPYLAERSGAILTPPPAGDSVGVEIELDASQATLPRAGLLTQ